MTANYSLQLTEQVKDTMRRNLTGVFTDYYPIEKLRNFTGRQGSRDRIYTDEATALTMILTATQQDRSLQNSVNIFSELHNEQMSKIEELTMEIKERERELDKQKTKQVGRPKKYKVQIPRSKTQPISTNTAAYTKARKRLDINMLKMIYKDSTNFDGIKISNKWKGRKTYITDGTYLQMQDSEELRRLYAVNSTSEESKKGYPQALLQGLVEQGGGAIKDFELGNRHISELELISRLLPRIDKGILLLADDLYNSYAIFSLILYYGLDIIVPGKRVRKYRVLKQISEGDEIVEIEKTEHPDWLSRDFKLPASIIMRRIEFENPLNPEEDYVLFTTILDEAISKTDIVMKYFTRWDIEISIREIKVIMGINVLRGKTEDIVMKEILSAFTAYNLVRKVISKSAEKSDFSPETDFIHKCFEIGKTILLDKKGRVYNRWSPGRYGDFRGTN